MMILPGPDRQYLDSNFPSVLLGLREAGSINKPVDGPPLAALRRGEDQAIVASMRPGLTGIGSIVFRDEERIIGNSVKPVEQCYREEIAPYKAELETWYHLHQGLMTDLLILLVTVWVVPNSSSEIHRRIWKDLRSMPEGSFSRTENPFAVKKRNHRTS